MTSAWGQFRDFINSKEIGYTFNRQKLFESLSRINPSTIDAYRSLIQQAKFIVRVGRGQYKLISHLPEGLTMGSLFALLCGDNLTYVESLQNQKDFKILKDQFIKERKVVLSQLIEDAQKHVEYAQTIEFPALGLKKQIRTWKRELEKTPNPTKAWLQKKNSK